MILDFWHNRDSENQTVSPQDLLTEEYNEKEVGAGGISPFNLHDEVMALGYRAEDRTNSTEEDLIEAVGQGPVLAVVKLNMNTLRLDDTGWQHSVVVTAISDDGTVTTKDPWDGKVKTYTWDELAAPGVRTLARMRRRTTS